MDERRFADDEVAEIFRRAAVPEPAERSPDLTQAGMTLAELQDIGREVGVPPDRIAAAAAAIGRPRRMTPRGTSLGMPIAVGRTVDLPRAPTDREWQVLVGELREIFAAQGRESGKGEVRRWSNGNLFAIVEPRESGYRLRLGTRKSNALAYNLTGLAFLLMGLAVLFGLVAADGADGVVVAAILAVTGAGVIGYNRVRLPAWADERERQMEHIAARALALIGHGAEPGDGGSSG